jgi:hypothetical protein
MPVRYCSNMKLTDATRNEMLVMKAMAKEIAKRIGLRVLQMRKTTIRIVSGQVPLLRAQALYAERPIALDDLGHQNMDSFPSK